MKRSASSVPTFDSMLLPTIQALQSLGGSGTTEEIYEKVVQFLSVSDKVLEILHGSTSQSEVEHGLARSRTYLKKHGLLQNSTRCVWSLVSTSINLDDLDPKEIVKAVRDADKNKAASSDTSNEAVGTLEALEELAWHQQFHKTLITGDRRVIDLLAEVRFLNQDSYFLLHLEHQSHSQQGFEKHLFHG